MIIENNGGVFSMN